MVYQYNIFDFAYDEDGNYVSQEQNRSVLDIISDYKGRIISNDGKIIIDNKNILFSKYYDEDGKPVNKAVKMLCTVGYEINQFGHHVFAEEKSCEILGGMSVCYDSLEEAKKQIIHLLNKYNFKRI